MNCTTCKIGSMIKGTTTVTFDKDSAVIVFRHVPANVCNVCGDYTIDGDIAKELMKAANEERSKGHELTIVNYQKAA